MALEFVAQVLAKRDAGVDIFLQRVHDPTAWPRKGDRAQRLQVSLRIDRCCFGLPHLPEDSQPISGSDAIPALIEIWRRLEGNELETVWDLFASILPSLCTK